MPIAEKRELSGGSIVVVVASSFRSITLGERGTSVMYSSSSPPALVDVGTAVLVLLNTDSVASCTGGTVSGSGCACGGAVAKAWTASTGWEKTSVAIGDAALTLASEFACSTGLIEAGLYAVVGCGVAKILATAKSFGRFENTSEAVEAPLSSVVVRCNERGLWRGGGETSVSAIVGVAVGGLENISDAEAALSSVLERCKGCQLAGAGAGVVGSGCCISVGVGTRFGFAPKTCSADLGEATGCEGKDWAGGGGDTSIGGGSVAAGGAANVASGPCSCTCAGAGAGPKVVGSGCCISAGFAPKTSSADLGEAIGCDLGEAIGCEGKDWAGGGCDASIGGNSAAAGGAANVAAGTCMCRGIGGGGKCDNDDDDADGASGEAAN
jgi:hypothetical protein